MDFPFGGSAICPVDSHGELRLAAGFLRTLRCRSDSGLLVVGAHETDRCLTLTEPAEIRRIHADLERRRDGECEPGAHHRRARLLFGFAEEAALSPGGAVHLPPMMRRRAGVAAGPALVVGTGARLEVWNPDVALASADPIISEIAEWHLAAAAAA